MRKTVAIVGRPNVGKSSLFNRLAGVNIAIVHDQPGVTRDRLMAECRRGPQIFDIMDTGGIGASTDDVLTDQVQTEAAIALEVADLLLFVVDSVEGIVPADLELARVFRRTAKPVILVCNKADSERRSNAATEFDRLGFKDTVRVSAEHRLGIGELVDLITERLGLNKPLTDEQGNEMDPEWVRRKKSELPLKLAFVGRPNAGKSSLVNALLGEDRAIVSPVAGTTRDSLDLRCTINGNHYQLIDTAGIRRQSQIHTEVEAFSVQRALQSIERADLCVLVVDSAEGVTAQDRKVAQMILEAHKPCIILMNKWDRFFPDAKPKARKEELEEMASREFFFLHYAPVIATSATERHNLHLVFRAINRVRDGAQVRLGTGQLNRILHDAVENSPGPLGSGKRAFKLLYATQVAEKHEKPVPVPHFVLFANRAHRLQDSYLRYLESKLREHFPGEGLPFFLKVKGKGTKEEWKNRDRSES